MIYREEELVNISDYLNKKIISLSSYYKNGIKGSINCCFVRKSVADKLCKALNLLPPGYTFGIYDAWKPYEVQYSLYYQYFCKLIDDLRHENETIKQIRETIKPFVSLPIKDSNVSYVHSTGGAIDLSIIDENKKELMMGCPFNEFSDRANTNYYEQNLINSEARNNRRVLLSAMLEYGFTNLSSEWWHFDYGDTFWSQLTGKPIIYSPIYELPSYLKSEVKIHG